MISKSGQIVIRDLQGYLCPWCDVVCVIINIYKCVGKNVYWSYTLKLFIANVLLFIFLLIFAAFIIIVAVATCCFFFFCCCYYYLQLYYFHTILLCMESLSVCSSVFFVALCNLFVIFYLLLQLWVFILNYFHICMCCCIFFWQTACQFVNAKWRSMVKRGLINQRDRIHTDV